MKLKQLSIGLFVCALVVGCSSMNTKELIGGLAAGAANTTVGYININA